MDPLALALVGLVLLAFLVIAIAASKYKRAERQAEERARVFQNNLLEKAKGVDEDT